MDSHMEDSKLEEVRPRNSIATGETTGDVHVMRKNLTILNILGIGFTLTNSWFGIATSLAAGISSGGPVLLVYGLLLVTLVCAAIAVSLAELASAMPDPGGQYFWTSQLASRRYARFASYLTGWIAWAGSLFTCASIALGVGFLVMACIKLSHPDLEIQPWMNFVAYQIINAVCFCFNVSSKALPSVTLGTLWTSVLAFVVILITVPAKAPSHQPARFVFTEFINNTGWSNDGIAFITGLITPNWAFNGLDGATHMAAEVVNPERVIPIALLGTVAIGSITAWLFCIGMLFSIGDFDAVAGTETGAPILELFNQALGSRAGSIVLVCFIILSGCGCLIASHTWQARLCWSFARDNGLPASRYLAQIHPTLRIPLRAHIVSSAIVAVLGCLYLASYTAFNSMVTACIVLLYMSYAIPVLCLHFRGRAAIKNAPFYQGALGRVCNYILFLWLIFALVMYAFPPIQPIAGDNMNYVSVVYFATGLVLTIWWFVKARVDYQPLRLDGDELATTHA